VTALSLEAFIVRLYREKNRLGFLKAFTDQPEHITSGMSPLKNIMKELQLRNVHIYPRSGIPILRNLFQLADWALDSTRISKTPWRGAAQTWLSCNSL